MNWGIGPNWQRREQWYRRWLKSRADTDHVVTEIELALSGGVPIVPIIVDGTAMPPEHDLPAPIRALANLNATSVRSGADFKTDMEKVLAIARSFKKRNSGDA